MRFLLATALMAFAVSPSFAQCSKSGSCTTAPQVTVTSSEVSCCDRAKDAGYTACPDCLKSSFEKAAARLAKMSEDNKVALASAMTCAGAECPVGKRMEPTMAFLSDAVDLVYDFDQMFTQMASQENSPMASASDEARAIFKQRHQTIADVHDVMVAQNAAFGNCQSHCDQAGLTKTVASSSCSKSGSCRATATVAAKTATESCSGSCGGTKTAVAKVATGDQQGCCSAKGTNVAQTSASTDPMNALFVRAAALEKKADEMLACWKMCPDELAKLDTQAKARIEKAGATMYQLNPAMAPMAKAVPFYANALQRAASLNAKMMAAFTGKTTKTTSAGAATCEAGASACASECPIDRLLQKTALVAGNVQNVLASLSEHDTVSSTR